MKKLIAACLIIVLGLGIVTPVQQSHAAFGDRITVNGTKFYAGGKEIWLNAANTPWFAWNDFGGSFSYSQWDNHFQQLAANGINATRVWITCNGAGGININSDGTVTGATTAHWNDLDSLFEIAQNRGVYIKATLISFDHTITGNPNYQAWRNMYNTDAGINSMVNNYVIPFVNRYKNNPYLFSIEAANEIEWVNEDPSRGNIAANRLIKYVASVAKAVHDNSDILVTQGAAAIKWNSTTAAGTIGNWWSDSSLQAQVNDPNAHLDFYSPHFYDWQTPYWGVPFYMTPQQYGVPNDGKPVIIGEAPAKGSQGNTTTSDYHNAYLNGWRGVMAWTSNGVDSFGDLAVLGPATRYMRDNYNNLVYPAGGSATDTQAPTAPSNLTSTSQNETSVALSWTASTDNVGVTGYDIYNGSTLAGTSTTTSYNVTGLSPSTAYTFTVKAKDAAGNVSAASNALSVSTQTSGTATTATINDGTTGTGTNQFEFVGTWNTSTGTGKFNNDDHYSSTTNAYYQVRFNGHQIKLYGSKASHHGIAAVSIDGGAEVNVDFYGSTRQENVLIWSSPTLAEGSHIVKVRVKGTKNASSSGYVIPADRVDIISGGNASDATAPSAPSNLTSTSQTDTSVALSWTASTDNVGVTGYDIYNGSTLAGTSTTTSFNVTGLSPSTAYTFTVKAKDAAGNVSAASNALSVSTQTSGTETTATINDGTTGTGTNQFEFVGTWNTSTGTGKFNNDDHYSSTTNAYYQVRFNGHQIKLYGSKASHHGIAAVSIDGGAEVDVDFYGSTRQENVLIWSSPTLAEGSHIVKVRVKGTKNASSSGYVIPADRVDIISGGNASDATAPSAPSNLTSTSRTDTSVALNWTASTDNVGVTGYDIYNGSTLAGTSTTTSFNVTGLSPSTAYTFTVKAKDAAGNVSAASNALSVTTNAAASTDAAQYNFESGLHGFGGTSAATLTSSSDRAYAGTKSLKMAISAGSTASNHYAKLSNPNNLSAGTTVTFRIWVPSNANIAHVQPYVMDSNWAWTGDYQLYSNLTKDSWNTLTVAIPSNGTGPMKEIGVEVRTSGSFNGSVYIDSISW